MTELKVDSSELDSVQLETYQAIVEVADDKATPFIIVGASARDLVMHHGYSAPVTRATRDIDFAIQVPDWGAFEQIHSGLIDRGYKASKRKHRLLGEHDIPLDIIPFGAIATNEGTIEWPPDGATKMGVLGFQEALDNADHLVVDQSPPLHLPVVSPMGLILLKLVSWSERDHQARRKDAQDIVYVLVHFENIPSIQDALYEAYVDILEHYAWDTRLGGAHVAGVQLKEMAAPKTLTFLRQLLEDSLEKIADDAGKQSLAHERQALKALERGLQP